MAEKIVEVSIAKEIDVPEVRRNKELMEKFDRSGDVYQKGMKYLREHWKDQEQFRKVGLPINPVKLRFSDEKEDFRIPNSDTLNKMYEEMTYEKALALLQSFHNMMTNDKDNKNGLNFLNSLGRAGAWAVDLALLRLEQWNHDHRGLANAIALAIVEEDEDKEKQPEVAQKETVKVENKEKQAVSVQKETVKKSLTAEEKKEIERNREWMVEIPKGALFLKAFKEKETIKDGANPFGLTGKNLEAFQNLSYEEAVAKAEHAMRYIRTNPTSKAGIQRNCNRTSEENGHETLDIILLRLLEHNMNLSKVEQGVEQKKNKHQEAAPTAKEGEKTEHRERSKGLPTLRKQEEEKKMAEQARQRRALQLC